MTSGRVFWLFEFPTLLGGERSLLSNLPALRQRGYAPEAVCPADGPLADELRRLDVPLHPIDWRPVGSDRRRDLTELRGELAALLAAQRPDLVHANSLSMSRLAGPVVRQLRLPGLGHLRDIVGLSRQAIADLNAWDRLLAVSEATRQFHIAQGLDADRCYVAYNGVDLETFCPRPSSGWLRRELGLPDNVLLIGTVGQLVLRKGHDILVAAAAQLAPAWPQTHYVFVGECPSQKAESQTHYQALRAAFEREPLDGRGHFLGPRADVPRLLNEFTLLVHPARQEPLGRVLLESAAAGVAVVATAVGGTEEIFPEPSQSACLVPPDDPAALAAAIERLLADPARRQELGRKARLRAEAAFSRQRAAQTLIAHYDAVCGRGGRD
mgnify:FL=1